MCRISGGGDRAPKGPPVWIAMEPRRTDAMGSVALSGAHFGVTTSPCFRTMRFEEVEVATAADDMFRIYVSGDG